MSTEKSVEWHTWPVKARGAYLTTNRSRTELVGAVLDELDVEPDRELSETDARLVKEEIAVILANLRAGHTEAMSTERPVDWHAWTVKSRGAYLRMNRSRTELVAAVLDEVDVESDRKLSETDARFVKKELAAVLANLRAGHRP